MARGKRQSASTGAAGAPAAPVRTQLERQVPLSSGDGRVKPAPALEIVAPLTATEEVMVELGIDVSDEKTKRQGHIYGEDQIAKACDYLKIVRAELVYNGGHDDGNAERVTFEYDDGRDEDFAEGNRHSNDEDLLRQKIADALWSPAEAEWGGFGFNYTVDGTVTWTPSDGLIHNYNKNIQPDICPRCLGEYEPDTVDFHEVDGPSSFSELVCPDCYKKAEQEREELEAQEEREAEMEECSICGQRKHSEEFEDGSRCRDCAERDDERAGEAADG